MPPTLSNARYDLKAIMALPSDAKRLYNIVSNAISTAEVSIMLPFACDLPDVMKEHFGPSITDQLNEYSCLVQNWLKLTECRKKSISLASKTSEGLSFGESDPGSDRFLRKRTLTLEGHESKLFSLESPLSNRSYSLEAIEPSLKGKIIDLLCLLEPSKDLLRKVLDKHFRPEPNAILFINSLKDFQVKLLLRLELKPEQLKDWMRKLQQVEGLSNKHAETIEAMQAEFKREVTEKNSEILKKKEMIDRFKLDMDLIETKGQDLIKEKREEGNHTVETEKKSSNVRQEQLKHECALLITELEKLQTENRRTESNLRKTRFKLESELENWVLKYDKDMISKENTMSRFHEAHEEEEKMLRDLKEKIEILDEEYQPIVMEIEAEKQLKEVLEKWEERKKHATLIIQCWWRGYVARKRVKKMRQKLKKDKKKRRKK